MNTAAEETGTMLAELRAGMGDNALAEPEQETGVPQGSNAPTDADASRALETGSSVPMAGAGCSTPQPLVSGSASDIAATLAEFRAEYRALQAAGRPGLALEAYNRLAVAAAAAGRPLDSLRRHSPDETERFFALTVQGPDGHVYWNGGNPRFRLNNGSTRLPLRWWWEHRYGVAPDPHQDQEMLCGDRGCINPEHARFRRRNRTIYSDAQMLGGLQVEAIRLGHAPSPADWDESGRKPSSANYLLRFGAWTKAIRAAGLEPVGKGFNVDHPAKTFEEVLDAVRFVRDLVGHFPTGAEFRAHAAELRAAGHPTSTATLYRRAGGWGAIRKALEP